MSRKFREWKEEYKKYYNRNLVDPDTGIVFRLRTWVKKPTLANYKRGKRNYQQNIKREKKRKGYIIGVYKGEDVADISNREKGEKHD